MNNLDRQYQALLQDILDNGTKKMDRTKTGTISVFGRQIRHKMSEGFPLLTTKKMYFKGVVTELLWFLRGDTDIRFLWENNCFIWDGDWHKKYKTTCSEPYTLDEVKQMVKEGNHHFHDSMFDLGRIYGYQWRSWGGYDKIPSGWEHGTATHFKEVSKCDQIANLINNLKTNPDSRRLMVSSWNPTDLEDSVLPPCHYGFQVYTRELSSQERKNIYDKSSYVKDILPTDENGWNSLFDDCNIPTRAISLMWNQRSVDTGLGLSFNISSYSLLLMMIAKQVNMVPDEVIGNLGDVHLYLNHIEPIKEQLNREPYNLPSVKISDRVVNDISEYTLDDIILENYQSHPTIKMPLSN